MTRKSLDHRSDPPPIIVHFPFPSMADEPPGLITTMVSTESGGKALLKWRWHFECFMKLNAPKNYWSLFEDLAARFPLLVRLWPPPRTALRLAFCVRTILLGSIGR